MNNLNKTKKTVIFIGYACNNNCLFCCHSQKRNGRYEHTTENVLKEIFDAHLLGSTYLEIIGGEPTIRKDLIQIIKYAKMLGFTTIMIATNGRMLSYKEYTKSIIEAGINHIVFSIHGHNAELHDFLTDSNDSFEQMMKGIENVKSFGDVQIGSNTTIVRQNYKYLPEIGELILSLGIQNSEFIFVDPTHGAPYYKFHVKLMNYFKLAKKTIFLIGTSDIICYVKLIKDFIIRLVN
jgi:MoaA/NifB/PqqE/SkfB family radical SAM enzyme